MANLKKMEGDRVVWIIFAFLILTSIVCIFSSSSRLLEGGLTRFDIARKQIYTVIGGIAVVLICYSIRSIKFFRAMSSLGFIISMALLLLLDFHVKAGPIKALYLNEAWRIIEVGGVQVHVFEVVKVAMVMYLAWAMDALKRHKLPGPKSEQGKKWLYIYGPFVLVFVGTIPGSNSAALFIGGLMFFTILLGGGNARDMALLAVAGILVLAACFGLYSATKSWEKPLAARIGTGVGRIFNDTDYEGIYLNPESTRQERQEALDKLRQPYGATIAIREGGIFGKGPGQSTQRYMVPDMSEDYMYSFIIEEYGMLGGLLVMIFYVSLMARGAIIARNCGDDLFAKLAIAGLTILICGQAFLHMFVNVDIGPMTGQTLPLISHGTSAFLCFSLAFGIMLSFSRTARRRLMKEQNEAEPLTPENYEE